MISPEAPKQVSLLGIMYLIFPSSEWLMFILIDKHYLIENRLRKFYGI